MDEGLGWMGGEEGEEGVVDSECGRYTVEGVGREGVERR